MQGALVMLPESAPRQARDASQVKERVFAAGEQLLARLQVIDFKSYEPLTAEAAVSLLMGGAAHQILRSLNEALQLFQDLPHLLGGQPSAPREVEACDFDLSFDESQAIEGKPSPQRDGFAEDIDEALAGLTAPAAGERRIDPAELVSMVNMLRMQLRQSRERVQQTCTARSKWGMITEGEEARRRAQKALHYALTLVARLVGAPLPDFSDATQLVTALATRSAFSSFRADLLALTRDLPSLADSDLGIVMRDVRIRSLSLFLSPIYRDLRANDRYQIQSLRARIDVWLDGVWDDAVAARQILADVRGHAELLVGINNRETLVQHDRRIKDECTADLADLQATLDLSTRHGWSRLAAVFSELQRIAGRDAELDRWVESEIKAGPGRADTLGPRIRSLRERLAAVRV